MTDRDEELDMREKLARIEANQMTLSRQMDSVVKLLDRMVRVEERMTASTTELKELKEGLADLKKDVSTWVAVRRGAAWLTGIAALCIAAYAAIRK